MSSTQPFIMPLGADLKPQVSLNSPKRIWIINPFDQLPNETDVPLRYWALCRTFAEQGHEVIWWSSDFSHLRKAQREACPDTDGFSVRLVETPPYTKNISFARLKNHKAFADGFYADAMAGLKAGELNAPDRIVVSLPPLGVAEAAFKIRDFVNQAEGSAGASRTAPTIEQNSPTLHLHSHPHSTATCQVVVDIMDAWPETFYQALPKPLRKVLGPVLLAPMHRSAKRAYQGADKISAVGQSYLDLAANYLGSAGASRTASGTEDRGQKTEATQKYEAPISSQNTHNSQLTTHNSSAKPMMLCYHGTDLSRFKRDKSESETVKSESDKHDNIPNSSFLISNSLNTPLRTVYLGSMGQGYDLMTIIQVAARWKAECQFPFQIHFAGTGSQLEKLEASAKALGLSARDQKTETRDQNAEDGKQHEPSDKSVASTTTINDSERIVFHGQLKRDAVNELLLSADLAVVPNRPDSLVACPYKAGEYAAAGLPMVSCLGGELNDLLKQWHAGSEYNEGDAASLHAAFKKYSTDPQLLNQQSINARSMGEALFDRSETYFNLVEFILNNSNYTQD